MDKEIRFYEIDLLRFISAMMIVIFHYTFVGHMLSYAPDMKFEAVDQFSRYLYLGINFFFIISGFVIFMSAQDGQVKRFIVSRVVRLYPAYWFGVIFTGLVIYFFSQYQSLQVALGQWLANLSMVQSVFDIANIESAYWTLWIELKFYGVILILIVFRVLKYITHLIFVTLVASIFWLTNVSAEVNPFILAFPHWAGYFATGIVFYLIRRDGCNGYRALLLALSIVFIGVQNVKFVESMHVWYEVEFSISTVLCLNALFLSCFVVIAFKESNSFRTPKFLVLGALSYPLYLIHQNAGYVIFNRLVHYMDSKLLVVLITAMMLLLAYVIYRFVETPLASRLKTQFTGLSKRARLPERWKMS